MAYWWVSQNKTFAQDLDGGFLWTPQRDRRGACPQHWWLLSKVLQGDTLFSYVGKSIKAVIHADTDARESYFPSERATTQKHGHDDTSSLGWLVDVTYKVLSPALLLAPLTTTLQSMLPHMYSPLKEDGTGALGFIFSIPPRAGRLLLEHCDGTASAVCPGGNASPEVDALSRSPLDQTERQALIQSRLGQGRFRQDVLSYWRGECAVTGLSIEPLLRASHIKPWRDSNNAERLDPFNGILLGPSYDAAFDRGLISFQDSGAMLVSEILTQEQCRQLGIDSSLGIARLQGRHLSYLSHHRESVFIPETKRMRKDLIMQERLSQNSRDAQAQGHHHNNDLR